MMSKRSAQNLWQAWWIHATFIILKLLLVTGIVVVLAGVVIPNLAREFGN